MGKLGYADLAAQAEKSGYGQEPLPRGEYKAAVTGAKFGTSKKGGDDQYTVELTVLKGDYKGRKAWLYLTKTEKALGMFFQRLAVLGVDSTFLAEIDDEDVDEWGAIVCAELINAECTLVCDPPEEYGGIMRTRVKNIKPVLEGATTRSATPDDDDEPSTPRRRPRNPIGATPDAEAEGYEDDEEDDEPAPRRRGRRGSARGSDGLPPGV